MDRYAIFLDAGYVYAEGGKLCCGTGQRKGIQLDVAGLHGYLTKLAEAWTGLTALRMYWYDAARDGVANPSQRRVARLPNIKLRLGRLVSGRQKGVDALIYHDLMTLARTRAISDAILVSGDEDLREGVRTVQQMGVRVLLIGIAPSDQQSNQSRELLQEVDETQILTKDELDRFMDLRRPTSSPAAAESSGTAAGSAAAEFAKNWSDSATESELSDLHASRPRIPQSTDVLLLKHVEERIGVSLRGQEQIRRLVRETFWETVGQSPRRDLDAPS